MIAWTSPLRTDRSIPRRISRSRWPRGATRRPRISRVWSSVTIGWGSWSVRGGWSGGARTRTGGMGDDGRRQRLYRDELLGERLSLRHEIGEGHRVERSGDRVADAKPEEVDGAARGSFAADVRRIVRHADHRCDRPLERPQDLGHRDLGGGPGELVAAVGAARAGHEARVPKHDRELLEVRPREVLLGGHLGEARRSGADVPAELDHQSNAVLALRAEGERTRAVEGGAVRG